MFLRNMLFRRSRQRSALIRPCRRRHLFRQSLHHPACLPLSATPSSKTMPSNAMPEISAVAHTRWFYTTNLSMFLCQYSWFQIVTIQFVHQQVRNRISTHTCHFFRHPNDLSMGCITSLATSDIPRILDSPRIACSCWTTCALARATYRNPSEIRRITSCCRPEPAIVSALLSVLR